MPEPIEGLFDLPYTELLWIRPSATPFLFQNKLEVTFEDGFYASKYPVTQELYERVMEKNPSYFNVNYG